MAEKSLGVFEFGYHRIEVFVDTAKCGGEFYGLPKGGGFPKIVVGIDHQSYEWSQCVSVLMHEVFEFLMAIQGLRYQPAPGMSWGSDRYVFNFDHNQFSELVTSAADGLVAVMPKLAKAFKSKKAK